VVITLEAAMLPLTLNWPLEHESVVAVTAAVASVTTVLFILMALDGPRDWIQRLDASFYRQMVSIRSVPATWVAKTFNVLGSVWVTLPVRVAIASFLAVKRRWWHLAAFASAVVAAEVLIGSLKVLYDRPRPPAALVPTTGGSFPSGHAMAASVTTVAAVIALFPEGRRRYVWGAAAVAFSSVMAVSRAYLLAHWLSDAIAGVLLGTTVALGVALIVQGVCRRGRHDPVVPNRGTVIGDRPLLPGRPP